VRREKRMQCCVTKLLPVICLKRKNEKMMLCGDIRVVGKKMGKYFTLVTQQECPCVVCEVINNNKIILITRIAQDRECPNTSMYQLKGGERKKGVAHVRQVGRLDKYEWLSYYN
jgi:hypothetical protein